MNALAQRQADPDNGVDRVQLFRRLFDDHFEYVCRAMRRMGVAESDVMDEAHNAFVAVFQHLGDYDEARPIKPWLYGFAVRTASNYRRGLGRAGRALGARVDCDTLSQEGIERSAGARDLVHRTLKHLPLPLRCVLVMHEMEGMDAGDIAEALSIPLNTVYTRLRRARMEFSSEALNLVVNASLEPASNDTGEHHRRARNAILAQILLASPPVDNAGGVGAAASQVAPHAASAGASALQNTIGWLLGSKVVVAAVFAAGIGIGSAVTTIVSRPPSTPAMVHSAPVASHAPPASTSPTAEPAEVAELPPTIHPNDLPPVAPLTASSASKNSASNVSSPIARERQLIDTATAALARGRPQQALDVLATHAQQFPNGQMAQERTTLQQRARHLLAGASQP